MNHTLSKVKVYQSSDYKRFRNIDGNRPINNKKIDRIIAEINSGNDVLDEQPMLVKENGKWLDVLDGQHRLIVAEKLERPAHYIIKIKEMSLYNIAKVNTNTEKWKFDDYINCYIKAGNNNYKKLKEFHDKYGISIGVCVTLLTVGDLKSDGGAKHTSLGMFQQGLFEIKYLKEATMIAEICKSFEPFTGWSARPFIIAICKIISANLIVMDELVDKYKKNQQKLVLRSRWKEYLVILQEIFNINKSKQYNIY